MTVEEKIKIVRIALFVIGIIAVALTFYLSSLSAEKNKSQDKKSDTHNERLDEHKNKLDKHDDQLDKIEKLLSVISYQKSSNDELFENFLKKKFNLSYNQFLSLIEKAKNQEKDQIQKALALYISNDYKESFNVFKNIINNSTNDYDIAISNAFIGSISLNQLVNDENINPENHLIDAKNFFEKQNERELNESYLIQKAEIYSDLGILYKRKGNFQKSNKFYNKSLKLYQKLNSIYLNKYNLDIGKQYHNLFVLFYDYKDSEAIIFLEKAYQYKKKVYELDSSSLSTFLNTINSLGNFFSSTNPTKSNDYFLEGILLIENTPQTKNPENLHAKANLYANYGFFLKKTATTIDSFKKAVSNMEKAEKIYNDLFLISKDENIISYSNCLHNLGVAYSDINDFKKSSSYYKKAIKIREDLLKTLPGFYYSVQLGNSYLAFSNLLDEYKNPKAKEYAKKSIELYKPFLSEDPSLQKWIQMAQNIIDK